MQSNLKFARQFAATPHIVVDFRGADLHKQLERAALQRLLEHFHSAGTSSAGTTAQPLNCPYTKVKFLMTFRFIVRTILLAFRSVHVHCWLTIYSTAVLS